MAYRVVEINEIQNNSDVAIGVKFPFDGPGIFRKTFTTDDQALTNIKSLLLTRKGERYEQPNFGTDLLNVLFEPITDGLKSFIEETISDSINFWLPYIQISSIDIVTFEDDPTLQYNVKIAINFDLIETVENDTIVIFASENQLRVE